MKEKTDGLQMIFHLSWYFVEKNPGVRRKPF